MGSFVHPGDRNAGSGNPPTREPFQAATFLHCLDIGNIVPIRQGNTIQDFLQARCDFIGTVLTREGRELALVDAVHDPLAQIGIFRSFSVKIPILLDEFMDLIAGFNKASQRVPWAGRISCLDFNPLLGKRKSRLERKNEKHEKEQHFRVERVITC